MIQEWAAKVDGGGETPISRVLKSGHASAANLILAVAQEDPRDPARRAPAIIEAARLEQVARVRELLEQGADPNTSDHHGLTVLHWAAITGCMDLARLLVNRGAHVNPREELLTDLTPLALARWLNRADLAEFLAGHGGLC